MATIKAKAEPKRARHSQAWEDRWVYRTSQWQRIRDIELNASPWCVDCGIGENMGQPLTVDHVIPYQTKPTKAEQAALAFDRDNLAVRCRSCHQTKTRSQ